MSFEENQTKSPKNTLECIEARDSFSVEKKSVTTNFKIKSNFYSGDLKKKKNLSGIVFFM